MIEFLQSLAEAHQSRFTESLVLFLIPFIHEDVAIFVGSLMVVERSLPLPLALVSIYVGMITSDFALYGIGRLAARSGAFRHLFRLPRVERLKLWIEGNATGLIVVARLIPGLMFPVYVACGFVRVRLLRFGLVTAVSGVIYLPIVFLLVWAFGQTVLTRLGLWSWGLAFLFLGLMLYGWTGGPDWQRALSGLSRGPRAFFRSLPALAAKATGTHRGMPSLVGLDRTVSLAEKIPPVLFYVPLAIQWIWLGLRHRSQSLPTLANPKIEQGGLWGESKTAYLDMVAPAARHWLADYVTIDRRTGENDAAVEADLARALAAMKGAALEFPVVVKPDIGWRGFGVQLVADAEALRRYIAEFPEGQTLMLQRPVMHDGEAGVLYARMPGEAEGRVLSLTFRYFPYVVGDGHSTLRDLILSDQRSAWKAGAHLGLDAMHEGERIAELDRVPAAGEIVRLSFIGSNRVGGLYRDGRAEITPALSRRFDEISKAIPEFYYGRYDIRFASVERLREGEDFGIIEINGAGGESINVWDPEMPLSQVYRELFDQQRLLFEIGARNRASGYRPTGYIPMLLSAWRQHRLIVSYPPSD